MHTEARQLIPPNRVRYPTDWSFASIAPHPVSPASYFQLQGLTYLNETRTHPISITTGCMQRSSFAPYGNSFRFITQFKYAYRKLRGLCRWGHLHTGHLHIGYAKSPCIIAFIFIYSVLLMQYFILALYSGSGMFPASESLYACRWDLHTGSSTHSRYARSPASSLKPSISVLLMCIVLALLPSSGIFLD